MLFYSEVAPLAQEAMIYARQKITGGSAMKHYPDVSNCSTKRAEKYSIGSVIARRQLQDQQHRAIEGKLYHRLTHDEIIAYAHTIINNKTADSFGYACVAYYYIFFRLHSSSLSFDLDIAKTGKAAFVVLNQYRSSFPNVYPQSFHSWSHDAVICDPFIGVVCPPRQYNEKWCEQMKLYSNRGMQINGVDPNLRYWLDHLTKSQKHSAIKR